MDKAIVDSDFKKTKTKKDYFFVCVCVPVFLGVLENSELCIDKQLNQLYILTSLEKYIVKFTYLEKPTRAPYWKLE